MIVFAVQLTVTDSKGSSSFLGWQLTDQLTGALGLPLYKFLEIYNSPVLYIIYILYIYNIYI